MLRWLLWTRVAVECVDDRVSSILVFGITRWKEYEHVAVDLVPLEISFECRSVNFNSFDCYGFCVGYHGRDVGLNLCEELRR